MCTNWSSESRAASKSLLDPLSRVTRPGYPSLSNAVKMAFQFINSGRPAVRLAAGTRTLSMRFWAAARNHREPVSSRSRPTSRASVSSPTTKSAHVDTVGFGVVSKQQHDLLLFAFHPPSRRGVSASRWNIPGRIGRAGSGEDAQFVRTHDLRAAQRLLQVVQASVPSCLVGGSRSARQTKFQQTGMPPPRLSDFRWPGGRRWLGRPLPGQRRIRDCCPANCGLPRTTSRHCGRNSRHRRDWRRSRR